MRFFVWCECSYGIYSKKPVISRVYRRLRSSIYIQKSYLYRSVSYCCPRDYIAQSVFAIADPKSRCSSRLSRAGGHTWVLARSVRVPRVPPFIRERSVPLHFSQSAPRFNSKPYHRYKITGLQVQSLRYFMESVPTIKNAISALGKSQLLMRNAMRNRLGCASPSVSIRYWPVQFD